MITPFHSIRPSDEDWPKWSSRTTFLHSKTFLWKSDSTRHYRCSHSAKGQFWLLRGSNRALHCQPRCHSYDFHLTNELYSRWCSPLKARIQLTWKCLVLHQTLQAQARQEVALRTVLFGSIAEALVLQNYTIQVLQNTPFSSRYVATTHQQLFPHLL